jgi:poly(3-hydroxyalkanoate) synthetase
VEKATGQREVNLIGYCIAGTLLAAALAYIEASGEYKNRIKSATFLAAQVDFSESGDLQVFVDDEQLQALRTQMQEAGDVLEGSKMAMTFNMLRANDLIWSSWSTTTRWARSRCRSISSTGIDTTHAAQSAPLLLEGVLWRDALGEGG